MKRPYDPWKRIIDVSVAGAGIVVTAPLLIVISLLVRRYLGSPVLFKQERPGKDGEIFTLIKFRSMKDIDEAAGLVSDEQRLTAFGQALRSSSLDELPSLWNVLVGEMSLVGPRPLLVEYLDLYTPEQARRHEVRPGITGLAQVRGRNAIGWDEKFVLDIEYVDTRSLKLDLGILRDTIAAVAGRRGISHAGQATMHMFKGTVS